MNHLSDQILFFSLAVKVIQSQFLIVCHAMFVHNKDFPWWDLGKVFCFFEISNSFDSFSMVTEEEEEEEDRKVCVENESEGVIRLHYIQYYMKT